MNGFCFYLWILGWLFTSGYVPCPEGVSVAGKLVGCFLAWPIILGNALGG